MLVEKYRSDGDIRYRLDGKRISAAYAQEIQIANPDIKVVDNTAISEVVSERLTAIRQIETLTGTTFYVDHTVKIENGVYARNDKGSELELRDESVTLKKGTVVTIYELDISETRFIAEMQAATEKALKNGEELETLQIKGKSGKIYTYDANTLEVISVENAVVEKTTVEEPVTEELKEKLVDYVITQRKNVQAEILKKYRENKVA